MGTHAFKNDERILQLHISKSSRALARPSACLSLCLSSNMEPPPTGHCVDIIRQVLMCNVDTALLGQVWFDQDAPTAFPDFNTQHRCKNYDAVRQWSEKLQVGTP